MLSSKRQTYTRLACCANGAPFEFSQSLRQLGFSGVSNSLRLTTIQPKNPFNAIKPVRLPSNPGMSATSIPSHHHPDPRISDYGFAGTRPGDKRGSGTARGRPQGNEGHHIMNHR